MTNKINNRTKQAAHKSKKNKGYAIPEKTNYWLLAPIIFVLTVLPFITRLKISESNLSGFPWFPVKDTSADFFLYYKQVFFLLAVLYMAVIVIFKAYLDKKSLTYAPILIPLAAYVGLAILSSVISKYRSYSFRGTHDHFESLFVLIGYCLIVYYIFLFVKTEKDLEILINCFVISTLFMSLLGLTQFLGKDFLASEFGLKLILPKLYWDRLDSIIFQFEEHRVYLTLHNPNYVGSYVALAAPLLLILALLIRKKLWKLPLYLLALAGILVCLVGSKSKTAIIALIAAGILSLILLSRYMIKYFYLSIPVLLLIIGSVLTYNHANDNILIKQIKTAIHFEKAEPSLQDIQTLDNEVLILYNGNQLHIHDYIVENIPLFAAVDNSGTELPLLLDEEKGTFTIQDERFEGFELGRASYGDIQCFYVKIDGQDWYFTKSTKDGTYYYITRYGKLDKILKAPSAVFTGYERYASGRGYIWSRTFPLLKKYFILGSGADTYVLAFPQQDYINLYNFGYWEQVLTKPHNLYLQTAVQTGVLSLIAYLVLYGMYFVSSIRLYIKGRFKSYFSQVGLAIFIATFSYMVVSFANDSVLAVAPIFWVFIGLGIVINRKVKSLLEDDMPAVK